MCIVYVVFIGVVLMFLLLCYDIKLFNLYTTQHS